MESKAVNSCPFCLKIQTLAQQLAPDCVWEFPHSHLFLGKWQFYHGYCVLVTKTHARELFDLATEERAALFEELTLAAKAIHLAVTPLKMNYELLGNQVPHLHWHLFPRFESDPEKLQPAWLRLARAEQDPHALAQAMAGPETPEKTRARIRNQLQQLGANSS